MFERRKARKALEEKLNSIQMNLENNYKDLAIITRREAVALLSEYKEKNILKDSDIAWFEKRLTEYDKRMQHYGHTDISSFLKERY